MFCLLAPVIKELGPDLLAVSIGISFCATAEHMPASTRVKDISESKAGDDS